MDWAAFGGVSLLIGGVLVLSYAEYNRETELVPRLSAPVFLGLVGIVAGLQLIVPTFIELATLSVAIIVLVVEVILTTGLYIAILRLFGNRGPPANGSQPS
jgi:uncharacterized membrane protein HdeD (DUF308 family)